MEKFKYNHQLLNGLKHQNDQKSNGPNKSFSHRLYFKMPSYRFLRSGPIFAKNDKN